MTVGDRQLFDRLQKILDGGPIKIPDVSPYRGTGAPGLLLEKLLGLDGGNRDTPDGGRWEIKFHSGKALLTLFHLEGKPRGHQKPLIQRYGWIGRGGYLSFRHTLRGESDRGFYVVNENDAISVRKRNQADANLPTWSHDALVNAFVSKLRRLIVVKGRTQKGFAIYENAVLYREPKFTAFFEAIANGFVAIDFDMRLNSSGGVRNHGTKFRVKGEYLGQLYNSVVDLY